MNSSDALDSTSCTKGDQQRSYEKNEKSERRDPAANEVSSPKLKEPESEAKECDTETNCDEKMEAENEKLCNENQEDEKPDVHKSMPTDSSEVLKLEQNSTLEATSKRNDVVNEEIMEKEKPDLTAEIVLPSQSEKVNELVPKKSEDVDAMETTDDATLIKSPVHDSVQTENIKNGKRKLKIARYVKIL